MAKKDTNHQSETTCFIRSMVQNNPQLTTQRKISRLTWWNKDGNTIKEEFKLCTTDLPSQEYQYY